MPIAEAEAITAEQRQLLEAELRLKITFEPKKRVRQKKDAPPLQDEEWG